ncbi:hypothetical protein SCP_0312140 [Sparassis crispa]|uniref:Uncharacterized protein n=1 Tax=Sparassis crispa TaxID=139825 RepID=A0A401GH83_9APHY|nr:hypothetical protein SCP_0312140 [Sparassis crispa]GBE81485.1 hypothetical protein SCP_0312140 [Sparassis crispa]
MRSTTAVSALLVAASATHVLAFPIAPASGSGAINWKKAGHYTGEVASLLMKVIREDPIMARAFEDELRAREAPAGSEALHINWKKVGKKIGSVASKVGGVLAHFLREEDPIMARAFDDELLARAFDDELLARAFDDQLLARAFDKQLLARAFDDELLARNEPEEGSEALHINWHSIGKDLKQFGEGVVGMREDAFEARDYVLSELD